MSKFDLIAGILFHAVSIWDSREKNKYIDRILELIEEHDEQRRKPSYEDRNRHPHLKLQDFRDNNVVDRCAIKLHDLGEAYLSSKNQGAGIRDIIKT